MPTGMTPLLQVLHRHRICVLLQRGQPLPAVPQFEDDLCLEPYVSLACEGASLALFSCGSFSYAHSPLTTRISMGRYCSVATGVRVYGMDHPWERPTTAPFTYDLDSQPFWRLAQRELGGGGNCRP